MKIVLLESLGIPAELLKSYADKLEAKGHTFAAYEKNTDAQVQIDRAQDADVIMFLHREEYYDPNTEDKNIAEVIVAKQRNGPLGTVKLNWLSEFTLFEDMYTDDAVET